MADGDRRRTALVTGAGSGLGRAVAIALSKQGFRVGLLGRRAAKLEETAARVHDGVVLPADVREPAQVAEAVAALGRLDVVVNCAALLADPAEQSVDPWTYFSCVLRTNVLGAALVSEVAAEVMRPGGTIVHVGSSVAALPTPDHLAYGASKAALEHLVRSLHVRYRRRGVRVVGVAPGALHQDDGAVDAAVGTVLFLLSRWGRRVAGTMVVVDGGERAS